MDNSHRQRRGHKVDHSRIKVALVCTSGGHFEQMHNLSDFYDNYRHFWITAESVQTTSALPGEEIYYLSMAHFKKPWTYLFQLPQCLRIFIRERPTHLLSTGSGRIVFVPFLLSIIFRAKFIHIETFSHVNRLTKLGRLLSTMRYPILTQWRSSNEAEVVYIGPIIKKETPSETRQQRKDHVFVTLGTRTEPFPRLVAAVETLVKERVIQERVIVQAGHTKYESDLMEVFSFRPPMDINDLIQDALYVITQESAGIGTRCLRNNTRLIVMPRDYFYGELPTKSDMAEDLHYRLQELGLAFVVTNVDELRTAIQNINNLKVGFSFDNAQAIAKLRELIEHPFSP